MKTLTKLEFETISPKETGSERFFQELNLFALSDKGRKVLTAGPDYIKTGSHVGVIQTRSGFVLEILPKIHETGSDIESTRRLFVNMLRSLHKVPKYRQLNLANLRPEKMPLFEIFISMFTDEVQAIVRRGVKSNYVGMEENCRFMRGKLVAGEHVRRNAVHKERFYVNYDEYIEDIPQNRVLKAALMYCMKVSRWELNRKRIKEHLFVLDGVSIPLHPSSEFAKIIYDRTTDYYAKALEWAMLFLGGKSFTAYSGSSIAYALLFPMELVFESYVCSCLKRYSDLRDITYQSSRYYLASEGGDPMFLTKPDIIAMSPDGSKRYIIDAKWKVLDEANRSDKYGISQGDMYQLLSYAEVYRWRESREIELFVVYPRTSSLTEKKTFTLNVMKPTKLTVVPFDIHEVLSGEFTCLDVFGK